MTFLLVKIWGDEGEIYNPKPVKMVEVQFFFPSPLGVSRNNLVFHVRVSCRQTDKVSFIIIFS